MELIFSSADDDEIRVFFDDAVSILIFFFNEFSLGLSY
jgi:hypothetical protein